MLCFSLKSTIFSAIFSEWITKYIGVNSCDTYHQGWKGILHYTHTYNHNTSLTTYLTYPACIIMLVPLGTGKSILWLGIISAQCNTTAITADKEGIERFPSRSMLNIFCSSDSNSPGSFLHEQGWHNPTCSWQFLHVGFRRGFLC